MKDYHINIFWSDEDGAYVADIPELKYCSVFGSSPQEALTAVMEAKDPWLASAEENSLPFPEPRYRPAIYTAAG